LLIITKLAASQNYTNKSTNISYSKIQKNWLVHLVFDYILPIARSLVSTNYLFLGIARNSEKIRACNDKNLNEWSSQDLMLNCSIVLFLLSKHNWPRKKKVDQKQKGYIFVGNNSCSTLTRPFAF
jgi:hypothetical protein